MASISTRTRCLCLVTAALLLATLVPACGKKKKKKNDKPKVEKTNWKAKWDKVFAEGEEGKWWIKQGFNSLQAATTDEARGEAYDKMIKGYKQIMKAIAMGEEVVEAAEAKNRGESFPEWERDLAAWTEEASKVRKSSGMPMEYIEKMNK
jgi:hypothetical protein